MTSFNMTRPNTYIMVKEAFKRLQARRDILPSDSELSLRLHIRHAALRRKTQKKHATD